MFLSSSQSFDNSKNSYWNATFGKADSLVDGKRINVEDVEYRIRVVLF